jgi:hypothetical protein
VIVLLTKDTRTIVTARHVRPDNESSQPDDEESHRVGKDLGAVLLADDTPNQEWSGKGQLPKSAQSHMWIRNWLTATLKTMAGARSSRPTVPPLKLSTTELMFWLTPLLIVS